MNKILSSIGLADSTGEISTMRVITLLVTLAVLIPAVYSAITTKTQLILSTDNLEVLGIVLGAKCVQNQQEKDQPSKPTQ